MTAKYHNSTGLIVTFFAAVFVLACLVSASPAFASVLEPRDTSRQNRHIRPDSDDSAFSSGDNDGIREYVEEVFGDDHIMVEIAACESGYRQYAPNGELLRNPGNDNVVGVFQLHEDYHEGPADDLGYDIYEVEGNVRYAKHLHETEGLKPWGPSSLCWDEDNLDIDLSEIEGPFSLKLQIGTEHEQVRLLQEFFNDNGYALTMSGPGSPGNETSFFGNLTKQAVQDFQCDHNIVCSGSEYTTGYGLLTEATQQRLNDLYSDGKVDVPQYIPIEVRESRSERRRQMRQATREPSEGSSLDDLEQQIQQAEELIRRLQAQLGIL